jgi:superfamily II DNA helicase RecQ
MCDVLTIDRIVRADKAFTLEELLSEPRQPMVQRENLIMDVRSVDDEDTQERVLANILRSEPHCRGSAIVYVWKRMTADQLAKRLRVLIRGGARSYHGSMTPEARKSVQDAFMSGLTRVVVATMAFGMGLDKPDIRTIVHFNVPKSIENYIQETGRGSRDGRPGSCVTLLNPKDYKTMRWMESGGGGAGHNPGVMRGLLGKILGQGDKSMTRHEVNDTAVESLMELHKDDMSKLSTIDRKFRPYTVSFEERELARQLNCQVDELYSMLVHFAFKTKGYISLLSRFPTKLKLRFFKSDPEELMQQCPLLRKVLPLAKKVHGSTHHRHCSCNI